MKKALFLFTIMLALAAVSFGQKTPRSGETTTDGNVKAQPAKAESSDNNGASINAGTMFQGELQTSVDVNKSKVGDRVVVKTAKAVKQDGKTVVAKGTRLVGRVTEIAKRSKENAQSRIGVLFDRIEGNNLSRPISLTIVSITKANANAAFDDQGSFGGDAMDTTSVNSSGSGRSTTNGGLVRSTAGSATGLVSSVANTTTAAAGSAINTVGSTTRSLGSTAGSTVGSTVGAVQNINIAASANGSASTSTTLSSNDRNFKLEKGATVNLRVDK